MAVLTLEGIVEAGQIRLLSGEALPEQTTVYVVVPDYKGKAMPEYPIVLPSNPRIMSPRLVQKEDAPHFAVEMVEIPHAGL